MDSHLEAAQALKRMLQQASVEPSERPSQLDWATLFDAHIINLENHTIILDKVLSLAGIADPIRKDMEAMRIMGDHSRQAAFGLKGLLVLQTSGIMGLSKLMSPTKFSTSSAAPPGQTPPTSEPSQPTQWPPSSNPFNAKIKIRNLPQDCSAQALENMFRNYEASNCSLMKDAKNGLYAVLTVPSGRMQLLACSEMNGRKHAQQVIFVEPMAESTETVFGTSTGQDSSNPPPTRLSAATEGTAANGKPEDNNHTSTAPGKEKRKVVHDIAKDSEPPTKRVFQANQPPAAASEDPPPIEFDDISDEVHRRLKEKEQQRQREKEQRMNPAGRKRMRESFESADFLLEAEPTPDPKRFRDLTVSPEPVQGTTWANGGAGVQPTEGQKCNLNTLGERGHGVGSTAEELEKARLTPPTKMTSVPTGNNKTLPPRRSSSIAASPSPAPRLQPHFCDGYWVFTRV